MFLEKIKVRNFKSIIKAELNLKTKHSIIVGENNSGKSTWLEIIKLGLTGKIRNNNAYYQISSYLFNRSVVNKYVEGLKKGEKVEPPEILIELYFSDSAIFENLRGNNNSESKDSRGVSMKIHFDDSFSEEYEHYITNPENINDIPIEYYKVTWESFSYEKITQRSIPVRVITIDNSNKIQQSGTRQFVGTLIEDSISKKEKAMMSVEYRGLKESFLNNENVKEINMSINERSKEFIDNELSISVDSTYKTSWENNISIFVDGMPITNVGNGQQNYIHTLMSAVTEGEQSNIILVEEPENNQSFTNLRKLIYKLSEECGGKQLIITTHDPFVLNALGIENMIMLKNNSTMTLSELKEDTKKYFLKLPGFDTLRFILSNKTILVEGPSDELIVRRAYKEKYKEEYQSKNVDIMTVRGLAFKRFLEIAEQLEMNVTIITDNDGDIEKNIKKKYKDYIDLSNIKIKYDEDKKNVTLEDSVLKTNGLENMNKILSKTYKTQEELLKWMKNNKTECALLFHETKEKVEIPEYILNAI